MPSVKSALYLSRAIRRSPDVSGTEHELCPVAAAACPSWVWQGSKFKLIRMNCPENGRISGSMN